jgi:hydrogenase small subunit
MAAAGEQSDDALHEAMKENHGKYLLAVDGSIPLGNPGYSTISGMSNIDMLKEAAEGAMAIVAIGSCAAFGGIPHANPNPTGAVSVSDIIKDKPIVNVSGCPPIPVVITGVLAQILTFGLAGLELDHLGRPKVFYGQSIHDRCYRRPFYERGQFAESFDDEGAKKGWCLYKLGCKGPTTYNACATVKWNNGTSFPIEAGHGCIGCAEPDFWDKGGFYNPLSVTDWGTPTDIAIAAGAGIALGAAAGVLARKHQNDAKATPETKP